MTCLQVLNIRWKPAFKDSTTLSHFKTAMQGGNLKNDIPIKALEEWLKGLQLTLQKLKAESNNLAEIKS